MCLGSFHQVDSWLTCGSRWRHIGFDWRIAVLLNVLNSMPDATPDLLIALKSFSIIPGAMVLVIFCRYIIEWDEPLYR